MVENKDILQSLVSVQNKFEEYLSSPEQHRFSELQNVIQTVISWLEALALQPAKNGSLKKEAGHLLDEALFLGRLMDDLSADFIALKTMRRRQDMIIEKMLSILINALDQVVEPAIKRAANLRDVQAVMQWGQVDIVTNAVLIENVLKLQAAAHHYLAEANDRTRERLQAAQQHLCEEVSTWVESVEGKDNLIRTGDHLKGCLKAFTDVSMDIYDVFVQINDVRMTSREKLHTLHNDLERLLKDGDAPDERDCANEEGQVFFGGWMRSVFEKTTLPVLSLWRTIF